MRAAESSGRLTEGGGAGPTGASSSSSGGMSFLCLPEPLARFLSHHNPALIDDLLGAMEPIVADRVRATLTITR